MKFLSFRLTKIFVVLFVFVLINAKVVAQQPVVTWNKIAEPSASLYSLIESGANLIASTDTGIYISTDNGQSWIASHGLPSDNRFGKLVKLNNYIFVTTTNGIWVSANDGQSWNDANAGILNNSFLLDIEVLGSTIFVTTGDFTNNPTINYKIYRSTNFGQSWIESTAGLTTDVLNAPLESMPRLLKVGNTIFSVSVFLNKDRFVIGSKIFRSLNQGQSWSDASTGLPDKFGNAKLVGNSNTIFAKLNFIDDKFYRSTDKGLTWSQSNLPQDLIYLYEVEASGSVLIAFGERATDLPDLSFRSGLWVSPDNGNSWNRIAMFKDAFSNLVVSGSSIFLSGSNSNSFVMSENLGKTFSTISLNDGCTGPCRLPRGGVYLADGRVYLKRFENPTVLTFYQSNRFYAPAATAVSAASYQVSSFSNESVVSIFGTGLSLTTAGAASLPLPLSLENTTVKITDSAGIEKFAPLFYISPTQINFQIPAGLSNGVSTVTVNSYNQIVANGMISIANTAPGLFTVNQIGEGFAAANVQRVKTDGTSIFQPVAQFNSTTNNFTGIPINVSSATDQVYLNLYGTGIRGRSDLANVKATVGGVDVPVVYAGAHSSYIGVDQINVLLPSTLAGKGDVDVILTVDAQVANTVQISIQ